MQVVSPESLLFVAEFREFSVSEFLVFSVSLASSRGALLVGISW